MERDLRGKIGTIGKLIGRKGDDDRKGKAEGDVPGILAQC